MSVEMAECQFCGKRVQPKYRRVCCAEHSPFGKAIFVEFYGKDNWMEQSKCYLGFDLEAQKWCGMEVWPNGGFVCQECFHSKHSPEVVS